MKSLQTPKFRSNIKDLTQKYEHLGMKIHTLRNWEKDFPMLRPEKDKAGDRFYTEEDCELIADIVELVYIKGLKHKAACEELENYRKHKRRINKTIKQLETVKVYLEALKSELL